MNSKTDCEINKFLHKVATVYSVSVWDQITLANHFEIEKDAFQFNEETGLIYVPYDINYNNLSLTMLSGTYFFLHRKRMIRSLPYAFELSGNNSIFSQDDLEKIIIANHGRYFEKELKLDSISLRLFKIANQICCATRFYPLMVPGEHPQAAKKATEYLYKHYHKVFDLINDGYIIYFHYLDPNYSDTAARTVYLRAVTNSKGHFLSAAKTKEIARELKLPIIKEFDVLSKVPSSITKWKDDCKNYLKQVQKIAKPGLYLKMTIDIGDGLTDQLYFLIKNPKMKLIHNEINDPVAFWQKQKLKLQVQLPENFTQEVFDRLFKYEIVTEYSLQLYELLETIIKKHSL